MIPKERWIIIQPTHVDRRLLPQDNPWGNDSFNNLSRHFNARLYHIDDKELDMTADVYWLINFNIELIEKEIEFIKSVKAKGAKVIIGFSQDGRFLQGIGLINSKGTIYTELCAVADGIVSGVDSSLGFFGRYEHKVINAGEIVENLNFSNSNIIRDIDIVGSGSVPDKTLAFELEVFMMIKNKYPDTKIMACIPDNMGDFKLNIMKKYPDIEFPMSLQVSLIDCMKRSKVYFNPDLRPRGGRTLNEAYYCRTPFIGSGFTYASHICKEYSYSRINLKEIMEKYELIKNNDRNIIIKTMEERAKEDSIEEVYKRIKEKLNI
jgi:hypothetical protein